MRGLFFCLSVLLPVLGIASSPIDPDSLLPPLVDWTGDSERLIVSPTDPWVTPAELTKLTQTPDYEQTLSWLKKLVAVAPELNLQVIGRSAQGRDIWMVSASKGGSIASNGKPTALIHAGIHAGEIDGKDAGLMLLRDLTVAKKSALLERVNLLFIPILNVDGHERRSAFNRMNQRGPKQMGWRTNARNLNLNRDFAKQETEGVQALTAVINEWRPDLYLDLHVTDGADYQHDITYGYNPPATAWSSAAASWLEDKYRPHVDGRLRRAGHFPAPLIFSANGQDFAAGNTGWSASPRFSNGWGDARGLPTVLLENHSLKPYRQRVLGTYVFIESSLEVLADHHAALRVAVAEDRVGRDQIALGYQTDRDRSQPTMSLLGIESRKVFSQLAGTDVVQWTGRKVSKKIPWVMQDQALASVRRPAFYYIPAEWSSLVAKLQQQGASVEQLDQPMEARVERYTLPNASLDAQSTPFEGHARFVSGEPEVEKTTITLRAGDWRVATDQPLGTLIVLLLEPQSPDSYFQWGYLASILQRTEYFEMYAAQPLAEAMLKNQPELKQQFEEKLAADPEFAKNPRARLGWFYERSPYFDQRYRRYPITRSVL